MDFSTSLQDQFAPNLTCFGCGPANAKGLQIKSFVQGDRVVARFLPQPHHCAFGDAHHGMINGGIIGAVIDCHLCWTGAYHLMQAQGLVIPPCCVTARYSVEFNRPTPVGVELQIEAWVDEASDRKAIVSGTVSAGGEVTARGDGIFVAVREGHPAHHRWGEPAGT